MNKKYKVYVYHEDTARLKEIVRFNDKETKDAYIAKHQNDPVYFVVQPAR